MPKPRNYKREASTESPKRKRDRAMRMRARRASGLKKGDPRTVEHKKPLRKGGTNAKSNLSVKSKSTNSADNGGKGGRPKKGAKSRVRRNTSRGR